MSKRSRQIRRALWSIGIASALLGQTHAAFAQNPAQTGDYRERIATANLTEEPGKPGQVSLTYLESLLPTGDEWKTHLTEDLLPYWLTKDALGTPEGNFPTFRANDGTSIDPKNPPKEFTDIPNSEGWLKDRVGRQYARMIGRQIFAYCVAYHMTGDENYLRHAKNGIDYLLKNLVDKDGHFYTWLFDGKPFPADPNDRVSQDMTYALLGPASFFYLTHDPSLEKFLVNNEKYIFTKYKFKGRNELRWVVQKTDDYYIDANGKRVVIESYVPEQRELVAQLDQINAYMLLATRSLSDDAARKQWTHDMLMLARTMQNDYFDKAHTVFWGRIDGDYKRLGEAHVDFGHTIKTLWMIWLLGENFNQPSLSQFSETYIPQVISQAYYPPLNTWVEKKLDNATGTDRVWWVHAELDQTAATAALIHPEQYVKYLIPTYRHWFDDYVDYNGSKEVWHGFTGPGTEKKLFLKAHLWKNAFHSFEHALVGYIVSQQLQTQNVTLYYAFKDKPDAARVQPYIFKGKLASMDAEGAVSAGDFTGTKYKVTFKSVKP